MWFCVCESVHTKLLKVIISEKGRETRYWWWGHMKGHFIIFAVCIFAVLFLKFRKKRKMLKTPLELWEAGTWVTSAGKESASKILCPAAPWEADVEVADDKIKKAGLQGWQPAKAGPGGKVDYLCRYIWYSHSKSAFSAKSHKSHFKLKKEENVVRIFAFLNDEMWSLQQYI